ncbi:hypothetical protein BOTBODRAFT_93689, partial [Botryobasidium botryosum FD-172 SS1]
PRIKLVCGSKPSKAWFYRFLKRHKAELALYRPSGLAPNRAQAFNPTVVAHHFELFRAEIIAKYGIPPENLWNMDEKGVQLSGGRKQRREKYLFSRNKRPKYRIRSDKMELVTIVECVSATGAKMPPGFIFSGKTFDAGWFDQREKIGCVSLSPNGWTDDFLCMEWFQKVFIPKAKEYNTSGKPICLVFDGHGSHTAYEMIKLAREDGIHLYILPPHTTHYLQPLDVNVFGPLQNAWANRCDELVQLELEQGSPEPVGMNRSILIEEYLNVREKTVTEANITKAWEKCGLHPFNAGIFSGYDFGPCQASSTGASFPASFP